MTEAVVDASVALKWFRIAGERHEEPARRLGDAFEAGRLVILAPSLLCLEILNVAGRGWGWKLDPLVALAEHLEQSGFVFADPALPHVARWTAQGLTAYDAAYVALAEAEGVPLVTDDELILAAAPAVATALATWTRG